MYELMRFKGTAMLFVQETHSNNVDEPDRKREWEGEVVYFYIIHVYM